MTLDQLRPKITRLLDPWVRAAQALGLSPDGVSVVAFALALAAGGLYWYAGPAVADASLAYAVGAVCVAMNGWLDVVDGALAREQDVASDGGDLLDHVLDRYADVAIIAGLAAGIDRYDLGLAAVTGVLLTSYLGTQAQAVGLDRVYAGVLGRADRLALAGVVGLAVAVYPTQLYGLTLVGWLLVVFAVVGHVTAVQRFWGAWSRLE
ncbi:CDP-alcohol phosphatidyltransferase family protein [Halorubellus sp. JP-L1]|uniref:CDP-alcohol phosphatidyltransferase family protein n=1 Tax=Halorubellus sp. JP-L1 TaxID=2715753 RepID=UPI0014092FA1|nr:CDP-alcohol phosphatidyltransferase family protein [Halorubellus sp. JP-L1]NHN40359.1 CDP-alcohol phosphatidyltransferase family protein [Halorubellus sp. JP-L1]